MVLRRLLLFLHLAACYALTAHGQSPTPQPAQRDPNALAVLQQSLTAMGGSIPADVTLTGSVVLVAGSTNENDTVRILIRGIDQSSEQLTTPRGAFQLTRSHEQAAQRVNGVATRLPLELVVTSHTTFFPLLLVGRVLGNTQVQLQYLGLEAVAGQQFHHIQIADTFADPRLARLTDFSKQDLWIDATTLFPSKLLHERRASWGPTYPTRVEVSFSNYVGAAGVLYPSQIQRSLNGTLFQSIRIEAVALNTGLTDADFVVQ